LAYSKGDITKGDAGSVISRSTETRSGVNYLNNGTAISFANDNGVDRTRLGLEGAVGYGPFKLQGQWVRNSLDDGSKDEDVEAYYVQALWTITGESQVSRYRSGAFSSLKPKNNFDPKTMSGGAWEVGVRYSNFDATDFAKTLAATHGYLEADAMTLGVKFVPNPHVRFMLDYVKTDFEGEGSTYTGLTVNGKTVDDEQAILFRTQFAF